MEQIPEIRPVTQTGQVYHNRSIFTDALEGKALNVAFCPGVVCPCKVKHSHISTCKSCFGTGFYFPEQIRTRMMITSFNQRTQYYPWSLDKIGTVSISSFENIRFNYGDRIIVLEGDALFTESLEVINGAITTIYPVLGIERQFKYDRDAFRAVQLDTKLTFDRASHIITTEEANGTYISIRYRHLHMYGVLDLTREMLFNNFLDNKLDTKRGDFPVSVVARRAHFNTMFGGD